MDIEKTTGKHETPQDPPETKSQNVNAIRCAQNHRLQHQNFKQTGERTRNPQKCRNCGGTWPHEVGKTACPAHGKVCHQCKKLNHFSKYYLSKTQQKRKTCMVKELPPSKCEEYNEDVYCFSIGKHLPETKIQLCSSEVTIIIDKASDVNIIDQQTYEDLTEKPEIKQCNSHITHSPYGGKQGIAMLGQFKCRVSSAAKQSIDCKFYVSEGSFESLLGYSACVQLKLVELHHTINNINKVEDLCTEYP